MSPQCHQCYYYYYDYYYYYYYYYCYYDYHLFTLFITYHSSNTFTYLTWLQCPDPRPFSMANFFLSFFFFFFFFFLSSFFPLKILLAILTIHLYKLFCCTAETICTATHHTFSTQIPTHIKITNSLLPLVLRILLQNPWLYDWKVWVLLKKKKR